MQGPRFLQSHFQAYRLWILERPRRPVVGRDPVFGSDLEIEILDRHQRRDWICQKSGETDWEQFRVALQHQHDLLLAKKDGETVGWAWIGYERVFLPPLGREIRLEPQTGYLYDVYVRPGERGLGIGRSLVRSRCRLADDRGIDRLLTHVVHGNEPSVRSLRSSGFQIVGRTVFLKALALKMWTHKPLASHAPGPTPIA